MTDPMREPPSALRLAQAMERLDRVERRANPPRDPSDPTPLILAAIDGGGRPPRTRLAQALEVVTGAPWPGRLQPGDPVVFYPDHVRVGREGELWTTTAPLTVLRSVVGV